MRYFERLSNRLIARGAWWGVVALVLLNFALSLATWHLRSPWLDENFTLVRVWVNWDDLLTNVLVRQWTVETRDIHPPLFFAVLKLWSAWEGTGTFALRFVSAASVALVVPLTWASARRLFDARTGLIAALLAALSPAYLWQASEIRMYAFVAAVAAAWFYLTARAVSAHQFSLSLAIAWLVGAGAALASHYTLLALLPVHALAIAARFAAQGANLVRNRLEHVLVLIGVLAFGLLLLLLFASPVVSASLVVISSLLGSAGAPADGWAFLMEIGNALLFGLNAADPTGGGVLVALGAMIGFGLVSASPAHRLARGWLILCLIAPVAGSLLAAHFITHRPSFRYAVAVVLPAHVLLGRVIAQSCWARRSATYGFVLRLVGAAGALILVGSQSWGTYMVFAPTPTRQDDWRGLADFLRQEWQPGDALMLNLDTPEAVLSQSLAETPLPALVGLRWVDMPRETARELLSARFKRIWLANTGGDSSFLSADLRDLLGVYLSGRQQRFPSRTTILELREYWIEPPLVDALPPDAQAIPPVEGKTSIVGVEVLPGNPYHPEANFRLRLYWKRSETARVNRVDVRLVNNEETWLLWSGDAFPSPPPTAWDDQFWVTTYVVPVPPGLPQQPYELRLTLRSGAEKLEVAQEAAVMLSAESVACCIRSVRALPAMWQNAELALNRVEFPQRVRRGETLPVVLTWTPRQELSEWQSELMLLPLPIGAPANFSAVLRRAAGSADAPPSSWPLGEPTRDQYVLSVPYELPAGWYVLWLRREGRRIADSERIALGVVRVEDYPRTTVPADIPHPLRAEVGDLILLGLSRPDTIAPGTTIEVITYWQVARQPTRDGRIFVHLYDAEGRMIAQDDDAPFNGQRSTLSFLPGDGIVQVHRLVLPADLPSGRYVLRGGIYDGDGEMRRWRATQDGQPALHDLVQLGELIVP